MHTFFQTCGTVRKLSISVTNQLKYLKTFASSRHSLHPHPSVLLPWEGGATTGQIHFLCGLRHPS